jgi:hypothetical protein
MDSDSRGWFRVDITAEAKPIPIELIDTPGQGGFRQMRAIFCDIV